MEQRKSNMELLRIISILMIISFHCAFKSGFSFEPGFSVNKLIVKTFWMFGELGVNLFVLISGYFMVNSHFKWKKVIRLLLEVQFYHWGKVFIGCKLGLYALYEWRDILFTFFPITLENYWFISAYIILYILSPYFNILIQSMDKKTYQKLLFTVLFIYSGIPSVFGFFFNTTETMLYYNRLVWMIIIYFLGAYMQKYGSSITKSKKSAMKMILISFAVLIASILIIDKFQGFFAMLGTTEPAFFWPIALPRIKAQWRISASSSMIAGPLIKAVGAILADFATHTRSFISVYLSLGSLFPSATIKSLIFGKSSQG